MESLEIMIFKERGTALSFWRYLKSLALYYLVLEKSLKKKIYSCSTELEKFKVATFDIFLRGMFEENSLLPISAYLLWNLRKIFPKWVSEYKLYIKLNSFKFQPYIYLFFKKFWTQEILVPHSEEMQTVLQKFITVLKTSWICKIKHSPKRLV